MSGPISEPELAKRVKALNQQRSKESLPPIEYLWFESEISTFQGTSTKGRVLFVYPDPKGKREMWIQYGMVPPGSTTGFNQQLSVITVADTPEGKKGYFRDFAVEKSESGHAQVQSPNHGLSSTPCAECHKSGGPLVPEAQKIHAASSPKMIERLRERVKSYGAVNSEFEDASKRGPPYGTSPLSDAELFGICSIESLLGQGLPDEVRAKQRTQIAAKIKGAMDCASCHDGVTQGVLTPPIGKIVHDYIKSGKMPADNNLTPGESATLDWCLESQYFGKHKSEKDASGMYRTDYKTYHPGALAKHLTKNLCSLPTEDSESHQSPESPSNEEHFPSSLPAN